MAKPLIRWTIGPSIDDGFYALRIAVRNMQRLYGEKFKYVVCYNGLSNHQKSMLPLVDQLVDQSSFSDVLPCRPPAKKHKGGPAWKLYPPRLDIDVHEIVIDNDIIIYNKPDMIEQFLAHDNMIVVTEAFKRSYSGRLKPEIPLGFNINTGIMCLPPNFDLLKRLQECLRSEGWEDHFDEQTAVAYTLKENKNVHVIPLSDISVCYKNYQKGSCGIHFVGLNEGLTKYWRQYIGASLL